MRRSRRLRQILDRLPDRAPVVVSGNFATPWQLVAEIDRLLPAYRLWALNGQPGLPDREGVVLETSFVGPGMRRSPRLRYVPSRLSMVPALFRRNMAPDLVVLHTSLPARRSGVARHGGQRAARRDRGRTPHRRCGDRAGQPADAVHLRRRGDRRSTEIDLLVEVDEPLGSHDPGPADEASVAIGTAVGARVVDGATLQAGIGAVPDAALQGLTDAAVAAGVDRDVQRHACSPWSGRARSTPRYRSPRRSSSAPTSSTRGCDRNERVRMTRTEVTNDPSRISANPLVVSINSSLEVDLFAQANASRVSGRIYSGLGGRLTSSSARSTAPVGRP